MYIPAPDKKAIISCCGDAGYVLYDYWMSKYNEKKYPYTDANSAKALGWSTRKAKDVRLKLRNHNWFAVKTFKASDGETLTQYYLGYETVIEHLLEKRTKHKPMPFKKAEKLWLDAGLSAGSKHMNTVLSSNIKKGYIDKDDPYTIAFLKEEVDRKYPRKKSKSGAITRSLFD